MYVGVYVCVRRKFGPSLCLVKRLSGTRLAAHGDVVMRCRPLAANKVRRRRERLSSGSSGRDQSGLQKLAPSGADVQMAWGMETLPIVSIASATHPLGWHNAGYRLTQC